MGVMPALTVAHRGHRRGNRWSTRAHQPGWASSTRGRASKRIVSEIHSRGFAQEPFQLRVRDKKMTSDLDVREAAGVDEFIDVVDVQSTEGFGHVADPPGHLLDD